MLEHYFKCHRVQVRLKANVLCNEIEKLIDHLHVCGYRFQTIQSYVPKVEHFGNWLNARNIPKSSIDKDTIHLFLYKHLPKCKCITPCSINFKNLRAALYQLLHVLPNHCCCPKQSIEITPVVKEVNEFKSYMNEICCYSESTSFYRTRYARQFLQYKFGKKSIKHQNITARDIMEYVANKAKQFKCGTAKVIAYSLRSYFRFLEFKGISGSNFANAVPTIPSWKLSSLPKTMTKEQLSQFLSSFDRNTLTGRRDYAIALCMAELGMRACEVATLRLDDIDWHNSTLTVRSTKTNYCRILPISVRLGKALVNYLKKRPKTKTRIFFLRHSVPQGEPIALHIVDYAIRQAYERMGLGYNWAGPHVLRHTAATIMHQKGATLKEVADVLGHKTINSTVTYTKLNLSALAKVALPWPEVEA